MKKVAVVDVMVICMRLSGVADTEIYDLWMLNVLNILHVEPTNEPRRVMS